MAAAGVEVVRWFVFTDARGGIAIDGARLAGRHSSPTPLDDLDALFALALDAGRARSCPCCSTTPWRSTPRDAAGARVGGHAPVAGRSGRAGAPARRASSRRSPPGTAPAARTRDLGRAVCAWDLLNEPDWIVAELHPSPRVRRRCHSTCWRRGCATRSAESAGTRPAPSPSAAPACASRRGGTHPALGLDFLQAHAYYDPAHDFDVLHDARRPPSA